MHKNRHACLRVQAGLRQLPNAIQGANPNAVCLGLASLCVAFLTPKRITRIVPSSLLALVIGTCASLLLGAGVWASCRLSMCVLSVVEVRTICGTLSVEHRAAVYLQSS